MPIKIVTDSACDLPEDIVAQYGITVVPLYINLANRGYLDGIEITREEFYRQLPDYNPPPTTAAPGPEMFCQVYDGLAAQGATEILSIHMSISLSATVDTARLCAAGKRSMPVTVFDSRQLSLGTGFLVVTAAQAAAEGRPMKDILALLEDQTSRTHVFAALDTLEYPQAQRADEWGGGGHRALCCRSSRCSRCTTATRPSNECAPATAPPGAWSSC